MAKSKTTTTDPVLAELSAIKRLMVLTLLRSGASQSDVGDALGIDRSQVSRMFPSGTGKFARDDAKGQK